jgi:hypothetical protein
MYPSFNKSSTGVFQEKIKFDKSWLRVFANVLGPTYYVGNISNGKSKNELE